MSESRSQKRGVYSANIMIGSAEYVQQQQQESPASDTSESQSPRLASAGVSSSLRLASYLPTSPDLTRPQQITALASSLDHLSYPIFSDRAGHLFTYHPTFDAVTPFLIQTSLLKQYVAAAPASTSQTPSTPTPVESLTSSSLSPGELTFRCEMAKKNFVPFRSLEPILDLHLVSVHYGLKLGDGQHAALFNSMDLIHPHSITRIEWIGAGAASTKYEIPQVVGLRTIFTLPSTFTIVSTLPFPGLPTGFNIELGPYVLTRVGSGHIYLAQPNSTEPPTILLRDSELKSLVAHSPVAIEAEISLDVDGGIAPMMAESAFSSTNKSMLVMSHGCVFRVVCDPVNFTVTEIKLLISTSPHLTPTASTTQPHPSTLFFRSNSSDYRLRECDPKIWVLDRMEGCIAEFDADLQFVGCIEPSIESAGITVQKPFRHFTKVSGSEPDSSGSIWLIDSGGLVVYEWTSDMEVQSKYEFGGRQLVHASPTPHQPLRTTLALTLPPRTMKPPVVVQSKIPTAKIPTAKTALQPPPPAAVRTATTTSSTTSPVVNTTTTIDSQLPHAPASNTIFVGNLSFDVTEPEVREFFKEFGVITSVRLPMSVTTGRIVGCAFVAFTSVASAAAALVKDKSEMGGRYLNVSLASSTVPTN